MEYRIAGLTFSNKEKARDVARLILGTHKRGDILKDTDSAFMKDFLKTHSSASKKIGPGIAYIFIGDDKTPWCGNCFHVMRTDGTSTDFSLNECLRNRVDTPQEKFIAACRESISDQVASIAVNNRGKDIHHSDKQFIQIVLDFIAEHHIDVNKVTVTDGDNVTISRFIDTHLRSLFANYHAKNAVLVPMSRDEHKSIPVKRFR